MKEKNEKEKFENFIKWEQKSRDTIDVKKCYIDIAGVLLSQIIYWFLPSNNGGSKLRVKKDGKYCIAKNRNDWFNECRISPKQYDRAIKILKKNKLVSVSNGMFNAKRTPHIFLNIERIVEDLNSKNESNGIP